MCRRWRAAIETQLDVKLEQPPLNAAWRGAVVGSVQRRKRERKHSRANDTGTRCAKVHLDAKKTEAYCVFRTKVTGRFGIVTGDFGNVTGRFGNVTEWTGRQDWRCA